MSENVNNSFPSNNHKTREAAAEKKADPKAEKKLDKVVTSSVSTRKKGLGKRIAETFTGDDARNVGNFVLFDVIVPATKSMISDAVSQGVERTLFGDVRRRPNGGPRVNGYTNYNRISTQSSTSGGRAFEADGPRRTMSRQARAAHDFDEIVLETRGDAEIVIEKLRDTLSQYDVVTVADLYDLVGITGSFTDNKWGWYNLRDARVSPVRGGYLLDLPGTTAID